MTLLERLIPDPGLVEVNEAMLDLPIERAWELVRHLDLGRSSVVRALFALRELPAWLRGDAAESVSLTLRLDDLRSTVARPGFQILGEEAPHEIAVGAIGKVWLADIPFVHVPDADAFRGFVEPGFAKVAWALRLSSTDERRTKVTVEVRVAATDEASWKSFRRYFMFIGPASRFIRRVLLDSLVSSQRAPDSSENARPLPGDELLSDAADQVTHGVTVEAAPGAIWPWLVQMGCRRAGFYSWDVLDNGGVRSAREVHPELQGLAVGDVIPATPDGKDGFQVLVLDEARALVLGGLFDVESNSELPFVAARPRRYWHVTWAFVLVPLDQGRTRLLVRARAACSSSELLRLGAMRFVHGMMESAQLRHLAARAEGRLPRSDFRDVLDAASGVAVMAAALLTPFGRAPRSHWGVRREEAASTLPGDELVPEPAWGYTHGVEIRAQSADVWRWVAQIGSDKAGFYSYQALENLAGCGIRNAESVHPSWEVGLGDELRLHPSMPPPRVVALEKGRYFVAHTPLDAEAKAAARPWTTMSWLFLVEPLGPERCRVVSRFRASCSNDLATRLAFGPTLLEPVSFAMDRRMLLGIQERAERASNRGAARREQS
jgi:hypothetical protein